LITGMLQLSEGDAAGAVAQLSSRPAPKGLEPFHAWYLGEALSWSRDRAGALKAFKAVGKSAPEWLKKKVSVRSAELLLAQGEVKKALPLFEAASAEDSGDLLYQRGLARLFGGQSEKGRADLKAVLVRFPAHPHAALAQTRLELAKKPVVFSIDDRFARQAGFLAAGNPKAAAAELDAIEIPAGKRAEATKASLALARATVLFALGLEKEAHEQLQAAMGGPAWVTASAMMLRARKLLRSGDNPAARDLMLAIDQKYPTESPADEASYLAGWIAMQAGDYPNAVKDFTAFEERHPDSKKRDEARWFRAYSQLRQDKLAEARATAIGLLADFPRSSLVPQAKYWAARCGQLLTVKPGAAVSPAAICGEYREVVATAPGSFYALLSQQRLRELGQDVPPTFVEGGVKSPEASAPPPELKLALELSKAGLLRDAWEETQARIAQIGSAAEALRFGHALQSLGEFGGAHALAARHLWGAVYGQRNPEAIALMYPRAYRQSVERLSKERGLDPFLAWAIMRRESAFKPEVFSTADARGLMQLIPPTARAIASALKIDAPEPDELYSPESNIGLGTWYLSALMERFSHPSLCAAAYNAGPTPVVKWASQRAGLQLDMWVEEIPYKETRGYVKQVTADYFIYRALYGEKAGPAKQLALQIPVPRDGGVSF
ncbi:MAG: murein transglycosylase, partial [Myxococcaceae bacterium]|nr:murein transglycosylase [Myxococcaceae bacterium]